MGEVIRFDVSKWKEKDFQRHVIDFAHIQGWWIFFNGDSRRAVPGWPDLVLIREPECIFVELKAEKGRVSPEQETILQKLSLCNMETHVWRPRDLDAIHKRLKRNSI